MAAPREPSGGTEEPLLHDFLQSFERPGASVSSRDVARLEQLIMPIDLSDQEILEMIFFPIINEACRVLDEGVVVQASDLDINASVLGMGFPKYRCDLISGISEDCYLELLCFLGNNWSGCCSETSITGVPIFKYTDQYGRVALCSISMIINRIYKICFLCEYQNISWLSFWNNKLKGASNYFFIPEPTQFALDQFSKREQLCSWMHDHLGIESISLFDFTYAVLCNCQSTKDTDRLVGFTHFLDQSLSKRYLTEQIVSALCESLPVIDKYGHVIKHSNRVLVPASVSKWVELACTDLWAEEGYVELGEEYFHHECFCGGTEKQKKFISFLKRCINAVDIPEVCPPDAGLPAAYSPLSKDSALLLLEWVHKATAEGTRLPEKFLKSIQSGKWLKTSLGYKSPSETFLCTPKWESLLQVGSTIEDIPFVDGNFYGNQIDVYMNELERLGVVSDVEECCLFITHRLMSVAKTSTLSKDSVLSMLKFIKYVVENKIAHKEIMKSFQEERWIKTVRGFRSPLESVMFNSEWEEFQQISDVPFVDLAYYGEEIQFYEDTLKNLGVAIGFGKRYDLITENFRFPILSPLTVNSSLSILECVRKSSSLSPFIELLMEQEWIKTNVGYRSPKVCFLFDPSWGCLLTWASVPIVDESFYWYGIRSFSDELGAIGVSISFEGTCKNIAHHVKLLLCSSLTKEATLSLLECFKQLRKNGYSLSGDLRKYMLQEKWIRTSVGLRSPCESALYNSGWEHISQFADLPFIDKSYYGENICLYMDELASIGVIVNYYKAFKLVVSGFKFPKHEITSGSMISLLECIKHQVAESSEERLPAEFLRCIRRKKWMKTCMGYRSPVRCFLYDSEWESVLKREDGPFMDESFYGPVIASYWKELSMIGVKVRVGSGCGLLSQCLKFHTDFSAIVRIYSYLDRFNWELEPEKRTENWVWIPNENHDAGEWVSSNLCVIHFVNHATSSNIKVLDRYYDDNLLPFFSTVFGVPLCPISNQQ